MASSAESSAPPTHQEEQVFSCLADHAVDEIFDELDEEDLRDLRATIREAINRKNVDELLDFMWMYDLLDTSAFGTEQDLDFEEGMALLRARLEKLVIGHYFITVAITNFQQSAKRKRETQATKSEDNEDA